jgi:hypothetical protein
MQVNPNLSAISSFFSGTCSPFMKRRPGYCGMIRDFSPSKKEYIILWKQKTKPTATIDKQHYKLLHKVVLRGSKNIMPNYPHTYATGKGETGIGVGAADRVKG